MEFILQLKAFSYSLLCIGLMNVSYAMPIDEFQKLHQNLSNTKNGQVTSNAIAAGSYVTTTSITRPLLTYTHDGGATWFYPASIFSALPTDVASLASFTGAICSKLNCLASGFYQRLLPTNSTPVSYPILGVSNDAAITWIYPTTIVSSVPSDFGSGSFTGSPWCSDDNCVVAGNYLNMAVTPLQKPLLATSHDAGSTWNYPSTIISNLPADFLDQGFFNGVTCEAINCYAVGQYQSSTSDFFPLLSQSSDAGMTWTYATTIRSNLPANFSKAGIFKSVSCNTAGCVAVGEYATSLPGTPHYPLIAVSSNGISWNYPATVLTNLPSDFLSAPAVNAVSCNADNCTAVGQYTSNKAGNLSFPLLLTTHDGGNTWSYPLTIVKNLPPDFKSVGSFNGAICNRNICIAVGSYQSKVFNNQLMPLLANSLDGGKTWSYPPSVIANLSTLPNSILNGTFNSASCNRTDCIAEGQYESTLPGVPYFPLLATSHDSGATWTYSTTVLSNLPSDYFNHGVFSGGNSSYTLKKT